MGLIPPFCTMSRFLSTPSARRATTGRTPKHHAASYFYPRPPRGGRRVSHVRGADQINFYPRPPRGGRRPRAREGIEPKNFYPRPPRGGRLRAADAYRRQYHDFYPRPPRGGRRMQRRSKRPFPQFLSTPSARRATWRRKRKYGYDGIFLSTPSARRATLTQRPSKRPERYFYPRPPRGGRPGSSWRTRRMSKISIHALREEGDSATFSLTVPQLTFLSTPSARRATLLSATYIARKEHFYPRPPRGGRRC